MLKIDNLHAYYGKSHVLHGVSFDVRPGEIVALLGRNGSGRSTTAKAIMGLVDWEGTLQWKGQSLSGKKAYEVAHLGLGFEDLVELVSYHVEVDTQLADFRAVKDRWITQDFPTWTILGVAALARSGLVVEIRAVAAAR